MCIERLDKWSPIDEFARKQYLMATTRCVRAVNASCNLEVDCVDACAVAADFLVTASTEHFVGCFVPEHDCVDQNVHRRAGPGLRRECAQRFRELRRFNNKMPFMTATSAGSGGLATRVMSSVFARVPQPPPPIHVLVTSGQCLPAASIVHVVAPHCSHNPSRWNKDIKNCYTSALLRALAEVGSDAAITVVLPFLCTGLHQCVLYGVHACAAAALHAVTSLCLRYRRLSVLFAVSAKTMCMHQDAFYSCCIDLADKPSHTPLRDQLLQFALKVRHVGRVDEGPAA
jgi:O-acetyl-ADP-ribose deacetylase (regulator of RNase III)